MIEINLLPKSYQKKAFDLSFGKAGLYGVVAAVGIVVTLFGITLYQRGQVAELNEKINRAKDRAAMLQKDIKLVDGLTDVKQKIQNRMSAVEKLDSHRSTWVRVLENVTRDVPEFVWLSRFSEVKPTKAKGKDKGKAESKSKSKGKKDDAKDAESDSTVTDEPMDTATKSKAEFEGYAFTLNALAAYMINVMRSDYFDDVELVSTKEVILEEEKAYNFVIECTVHFLSDEELRQMIGSADSTESFDDFADNEQLN